MGWKNVKSVPTSDLVRLIASAVLLREGDVARPLIALLDDACAELNERIPPREAKS